MYKYLPLWLSMVYYYSFMPKFQSRLNWADIEVRAWMFYVVVITYLYGNLDAGVTYGALIRHVSHFASHSSLMGWCMIGLTSKTYIFKCLLYYYDLLDPYLTDTIRKNTLQNQKSKLTI